MLGNSAKTFRIETPHDEGASLIVVDIPKNFNNFITIDVVLNIFC